jgi:hypothetical protein
VARRDSVQRASARRDSIETENEMARQEARQEARRDSIRRAAARRAEAEANAGGRTESAAETPRERPAPRYTMPIRRDDQDLMQLSDSLSQSAAPPVTNPTPPSPTPAGPR